jgi:hypothetical protein
MGSSECGSNCSDCFISEESRKQEEQDDKEDERKKDGHRILKKNLSDLIPRQPDTHRKQYIKLSQVSVLASRERETGKERNEL